MMEWGKNADIIEKYRKDLVLLDNKRRTILTKLRSIHVFMEYLHHKPVPTITRQDIKDYVTYLKEKGKKPDTQNEYIIKIKQFVYWCVVEEILPPDDYFYNIAYIKTEHDTSDIDYFTRDDILAMLPHCTSQRNRALLSLMWDSGGRVGEVCGLKVKCIKLDKKPPIATLKGKTGIRDVVISFCVPDIALWLQQRQGKPNDPLFTSNVSGQLKPASVDYIIEMLVKKANIDTTNKKLNPHSIRHGRITELADKGVPESHLRLFAGWEEDSDMPTRYIHPKKKAMMKSVLVADGYEPAEIMPEKKEQSMKPITCSRCEKSNPANSIYCNRCGNVLNEAKVLEIQAEQKKDEERKREAEIDMIMQRMRGEMMQIITTTTGGNRTWTTDEHGGVHDV